MRYQDTKKKRAQIDIIYLTFQKKKAMDNFETTEHCSKHFISINLFSLQENLIK